MMRTTIEIIEAKRDGKLLSSDDFNTVISGFSDDKVPDYQMSSLLMAIYLNGLTVEETVELTRAMVESGETLDLSSIPRVKIDKHSTGGVGDKVSLALVPIVAAAGIPIAKMSGRGLGITGGTLDKLESIKGFRVELSAGEIIQQVKAVGACICAQTSSIAPADKKIYALRDVTATVESAALVASSVMSKKIAGGADIILLDVKVGRGAFMKDITQARQLAQLMQRIGAAFDKKVIVEITSMDVPLGHAVGNLIEMNEVADFLLGKQSDERLSTLILDLAQTALHAAGSTAHATDIVSSGAAWKKFVEIVEAQGGDVNWIEQWSKIEPVARIKCRNAGYVADIDAEIIGRVANKLGAGRERKEDRVDPNAGIFINKSVGEYVEQGEVMASLYGQSSSVTGSIVEFSRSAFVVSQSAAATPTVILERVSSLQ